ncbi:MAG: 30S ribosomal protein S17 [Deltaproteobacteria bacterium]|nr:30S ribosomal protein S17 [Deltaproteobacteria bacterium]
MAEKKGGKPTEKKGAAAKVAGAAKTAAKAVAEAVKHPVETAKGAVAAVAEATGAKAEKRGPTPKSNLPRGRRRAFQGVVRSDKMDKTVVVEVVTLRRDPVYGKYLKSRERFKAHDEKNQFKTGDKVEIREHRPLSSQKRWIVSRLIEAAKVE